MLGILALPMPDESIPTFAGYLTQRRDLLLTPHISAGFGTGTG